MTVPLLDVEVVHDVFISGVGLVELLGKNARITFYVEQDAVGGGPRDHVVVAKLIVAISDIPECIKEIITGTTPQLSRAPALEIVTADRIGRH